MNDTFGNFRDILNFNKNCNCTKICLNQNYVGKMIIETWKIFEIFYFFRAFLGNSIKWLFVNYFDRVNFLSQNLFSNASV